MIYLQTLGVAAIRVGARRVLPSAARAFGALLFLAEERGRKVRRSDLQGLLFPDRPEDAGNHGLRQILYRLRRLGAPIETTGNAIVLPSDAVEADYLALRDSNIVTSETARSVMLGVLPGFTPRFSGRLGTWVEERRTAIQHEVLQSLIAKLAALRTTGNWNELESIAQAALSIDSLNEEATLALAESLALNGQKARAVRLLDAYLLEVSPYGRELRLPATVLRTRISERATSRSYRRLGQGPFVGRQAEITQLWGHLQATKQGHGRAIVVHGEPGIGKTRLAREFLKAAALDGATCLSVECAPHDVRRPLGVFVDLVPKLLAAPGGLGVDPSAIEHLHRLTKAPALEQPTELNVPPQQSYDQILFAVGDLLDAVSSERPVVILVDDAHSIDPASLSALQEFTAGRRQLSVLFLLTSRIKLRPAGDGHHTDRTFWERIRPLPADAASDLLRALIGTPDATTSARSADSLIELAAGNPLYLRWLALERADLTTNGLPSSLHELLRQRVQRISDTTLRAFVAAILLAKYCRLDRLVRVAGMTSRELLASIQDLETQGFLVADGSDIRSSHPMLSQVAIEELPPVTRKLMGSAVAALLQAEALPTQDVAMLWAAAERWNSVGAPERAVTILESCAKHCMDIGQPGAACDVISRALTLCDPTDRERLHMHQVQAARLAEDFHLVRSAIHDIREIQDTRGFHAPHDELELVELRALRFSGTPAPDLIPRFQRCIAAADAPESHRLEVASELLSALDLQLDREGAIRTYEQVKHITATSETDKINRVLVDFLFYSLVGEPTLAVDAAVQAVRLARRLSAPGRRCRILAAASAAMFRSGACAEAVDVMAEAHSIAKKAGMSPSLVDVVSMLAWMYYALGEDDRWRHYDHIADNYYKNNRFSDTRTSHYLSNKIEFAIEDGQPETARSWLKRARSDYAEINTPRSQLLADAFELRIEQASQQRSARMPLESLAEKHRIGRACGLHDNFAEAYWRELDERVDRASANGMLREYIRHHRRDGFPTLPPLTRIIRAELRPGEETLLSPSLRKDDLASGTPASLEPNIGALPSQRQGF